jgi:hypothetical protein
MAIDCMIQDCLILSDKHFNFLNAISDPEEYIKLDDNIIYTIEKFEDDDKDLEKAKQIVTRIRNRDLYKFIGQIIVDNIDIEKAYTDFLTLDNPNNFVKREDIELRVFSIDYGFGSKNPFDYTYFYKSEDQSRCFSLQPTNISLMIPEQFKEYYLRVYCKDKSKVEAVGNMFEKYEKMLKRCRDERTPIKKNNHLLLSNKREREAELNKIN